MDEMTGRHLDPAPDGGEETDTPLEKEVGFIELFFDLVFVYAVTQLAGFIASDTSLVGYLRGLVLLGLVWWAWSAFMWVTNLHDVDRPVIAGGLLTAMAASFFVSFTLPESFGANGVEFAFSYLVLRLIHLVMLYLSADRGARAAVVRFGWSSLTAVLMLVAGSTLEPGIRLLVWAGALLVDLAGPYLFRQHVDRIAVAPGHAAERYGLFVIVALGESIIAIGVGAADTELDAITVLALASAFIVSAVMWWIYFFLTYRRATDHLKKVEDGVARLVRESYSYLHVVLVAGIVLFAVGAEHSIAHASEPLEPGGLVALTGGILLFLIGHLAFLRRVLGQGSTTRMVGALLLVGLAVVAHLLHMLAGVLVALVAVALIGVVLAENRVSPRVR